MWPFSSDKYLCLTLASLHTSKDKINNPVFCLCFYCFVTLCLQGAKSMKKSSHNFTTGHRSLVAISQILGAKSSHGIVLSLFILAKVEANWQLQTLLFCKSKGENKSEICNFSRYFSRKGKKIQSKMQLYWSQFWALVCFVSGFSCLPSSERYYNAPTFQGSKFMFFIMSVTYLSS